MRFGRENQYINDVQQLLGKIGCGGGGKRYQQAQLYVLAKITKHCYQKLMLKKYIKIKLDELGIEPKTSPMLRERATNYATRPVISCFGFFTISCRCKVVITLLMVNTTIFGVVQSALKTFVFLI